MSTAVIARTPAAHRQSFTAEIMGTVASVQLITRAPLIEAPAAVETCFAELRLIEEIFSPFRLESDICAIARGDLTIESAHPLVAVVAEACRAAEAATEGRFSAWREGWFDPTGFVKGWAVERAARRHLALLLDGDGCLAAGLNVGGDMQLLSAEGSDWTWQVGIADPRRPGEVVATLELARGAVATSGSAERGAHIVDPRTGRAATGVASATVVAESLADADVWATAAVVAGFDDLSWISRSGTVTGLVIAQDGRVRRWLDGVEVSVTYSE